MSEYKILKGLNVAGKKVLVRVDYNVKFENGYIKDDTRITESIVIDYEKDKTTTDKEGTIKYLIQNKAKIIIMAHLGRPQEELAEGKSSESVKEKNALKPVAKHLEGLIKKLAPEWGIKLDENWEVKSAPNCVGPEAKKFVDGMKNRDIVMLANLRLHKEEEGYKPPFADAFVKSLANLCEIYVFDGFGVAHRAHASTVGVPLYILEQIKKVDEWKDKKVVAGFLMEKELDLWAKARKIGGYKLLGVGGSKLEEKTKAVDKLYKAVGSVFVGGAIYNAIMAGKGIDVGDSLLREKGSDHDYTQEGKELAKISNLLLAKQAVIAKKSDYSNIKTINIQEGVPKGYMITDIVIDDELRAEIAKAQVIIWFGNIGMSDLKVNGRFPFAKGTEDFKKAINPYAYVIVGGGDSVTASEGLPNRVISTGGGAAIKLYTKGTLDALEALKGNIDYFKEKTK